MTEFFLGLASGMVLLLLGQRVQRAYHDRDARGKLIDEVAGEYHRLADRAESSGLRGLLRSGVGRLKDEKEIEAAIRAIVAFGHKDPLGPHRDSLSRKDLHHFFEVIGEPGTPLLTATDVDRAISATRPRK